MQAPLDGYLAQVEKNIQGLPTMRRDDELKEMRAHLMNVVDSFSAQGLSDEAATSAAIEQFGTPKEIGRSVIVAWWRGEIKQPGFWAAAAFAAILFWLVLHVANAFSMSETMKVARSHELSGWLEVFIAWSPILGTVFGLIVIGGIFGLLFSKRAIIVTSAGMSIFLLYSLTMLVVHTYAEHIIPWWGLIGCLFFLAFYARLILWSVRIGNRWRTKLRA